MNPHVLLKRHAYLALDYIKARNEGLMKIALGRVIWNVVDIIVAIGLVCLVVTAFRKKR